MDKQGGNKVFYVIPLNLNWGEGFKVGEFESEEKLKTFLVNSAPRDKYMIVEGKEIGYTKKTEIILSTKE